MNNQFECQTGFTLLEMSLVLLVIAAIAIPTTEGIKQQARNLKLERGLREVVAIQEAGLRYYQDNEIWPANLNTLLTTNYLPATAINSPWGSSYSLSIAGNNLSVSVTTDTGVIASQLQNRLPFATVTNSTVSSTIGIPGTETAHQALVPRDGSRVWTGSHDVGGHSIGNINSVSATNVQASNEVRATTRLISPRFEDLNNTAFVIDPASTSIVNRVDATSQLRAPILYDSNNTAYYVNPASTSNFNTVRGSIFYDRNNTAYYVDPASVSIMNDVRASIIYDRNNTAYYVNPASVTNLNRLFVGGRELKASHQATFSRWSNYGPYGSSTFTLAATEYICGQQTSSVACGLGLPCARYRICRD